MFSRLVLVAFVAAACAGCARNPPHQSVAPEPLTSDLPGPSVAQQPLQREEGTGPNVSSGTRTAGQPPITQTPAGNVRTAQTAFPGPHPPIANSAPPSAPQIGNGSGQSEQNCQDGHGEGQSPGCSHGPHPHPHVDH